MKITQSHVILPLLVSGLVLTGCSSSSSPAPVPPEDDANPLTTVDGPLTGGEMTPSTETPGTGSPIVGGGVVPITESPSTETPVTANPGTPVGSGGGNVNTSLTGSISQLGMLNLSFENIGNTTNVSAFFFDFGRQFPAAQAQAGLEGELMVTDSCETTTLDLTPGDGMGEIDLGSLVPGMSLIPKSISAGEVITLTSPVGTFATLLAEDAFGNTIYGTPDQVDVAGSIPTGMSADIPGAPNGFPAFANVPVPAAEPLEITVNGTAASGYSLMWNGSNAANSALRVTFAAIDQSAADFSSLTYVECSLSDDGAQLIPANLLPTGNNVLISGGSATRTSVNLVQQGNSVLVVTSTSASSVMALN